MLRKMLTREKNKLGSSSFLASLFSIRQNSPRGKPSDCFSSYKLCPNSRLHINTKQHVLYTSLHTSYWLRRNEDTVQLRTISECAMILQLWRRIYNVLKDKETQIEYFCFPLKVLLLPPNRVQLDWIVSSCEEFRLFLCVAFWTNIDMLTVFWNVFIQMKPWLK